MVKFSTTSLAQDTKATGTDEPQRGICCLIFPNCVWLPGHICAHGDHIRLTFFLIAGFCLQYQQVSCGAQP